MPHHKSCSGFVLPWRGSTKKPSDGAKDILRGEIVTYCRVALKSALPHFVWRNYPETGKFRRDSCEFEEALVAGQRCCSSKR